jgi:glycogen synthase
MFGWELPPHNTGGLGTACLNITQSLAAQGVDLHFILPRIQSGHHQIQHMNMLSASATPLSDSQLLGMNLDRQSVVQLAQSLAYQGEFAYSPQKLSAWYAASTRQIFSHAPSILHCHEWMTFAAGVAAREAARQSGQQCPFIAHVHATEFDRGSYFGNPAIKQLETEGLQAADHVVAVSHYTKQSLIHHYGIAKEKISVVHNGYQGSQATKQVSFFSGKHKLILFVGRLTAQKGPEYFLSLAQRLSNRDANLRFAMIGSGDSEAYCMQRATELGLTGKILFSPFARGPLLEKAYQSASLVIMPSVSEPFGLVALEALAHHTPVLVSKQSGVSELSSYFLTANFWDIAHMESQILDLLSHPNKSSQIVQKAQAEVSRYTWDAAAQSLQDLYRSLLPSPAHG